MKNTKKRILVIVTCAVGLALGLFFCLSGRVCQRRTVGTWPGLGVADTSLHYAVRKGDKDEAKRLADEGFDVNATDGAGRTALYGD